jgi:hypothetical protein
MHPQSQHHLVSSWLPDKFVFLESKRVRPQSIFRASVKRQSSTNPWKRLFSGRSVQSDHPIVHHLAALNAPISRRASDNCGPGAVRQSRPAWYPPAAVNLPSRGLWARSEYLKTIVYPHDFRALRPTYGRWPLSEATRGRRGATDFRLALAPLPTCEYAGFADATWLIAPRNGPHRNKQNETGR